MKINKDTEKENSVYIEIDNKSILMLIINLSILLITFDIINILAKSIITISIISIILFFILSFFIDKLNLIKFHISNLVKLLTLFLNKEINLIFLLEKI